ncbi:TPA: site-specific integrase [Vibrio harveyi]|nr:site-specific integrase [Vibrio harveyi]
MSEGLPIFDVDKAKKLTSLNIQISIDKINAAIEPFSNNPYLSDSIKLFNDPQHFEVIDNELKNKLLSPTESLILDNETPEILAVRELERMDGYTYTLDKSLPIYFQAKEQLEQIFRYVKTAQNGLRVADIETAKKTIESLYTISQKLSPTLYVHKHALQKTTRSATDTIAQKSNLKPEITMLKLFELYKEEKLEEGIASRTILATEKKVLVVNELLKDRPLAQLERADALTIKKLLQAMPSNINKRKEFKNLPIIKAINKNKKLKYDCLSDTTVEDYLQKCSSLLKYGKQHRLIDYNPFEAIKFKTTDEIEDREPFSLEELDLIFSQDIFQSLNFSKTKRKNQEYRFWIPLLGLYTGARINELCQLYITDIKEVEGIWCLDIKRDSEHQRTKNLASVRLVPIHSDLIELGFLEYVASRQQKELLFDGLTFTKENGFGGVASKWFGRFKSNLGFPKKTKVFHSFRHTILDHYKQKTSVEERFAQAIVGHRHNSIAFDLYGSKFKPSALQPVVELLQWKKVIRSLSSIQPRTYD